MSILSNYARQRMMGRCFGSESYTAPKHGHHTLLGAFGWALWDALTPLTGEEKLVSKWPDWSTNWPQS